MVVIISLKIISTLGLKHNKTSPYGPPVPFKGNKARFYIKHASPKARTVKDEIKIMINM